MCNVLRCNSFGSRSSIERSGTGSTCLLLCVQDLETSEAKIRDDNSAGGKAVTSRYNLT